MGTIVCLSSIDWGFLRYRKQHLMHALSRTHHVIYVNPPRTCKAKSPTSWNRLRTLEPNLTVYDPPVLPSPYLTGASTTWGVRRLRRALREVARPPVVLWCYSPHAVRFLGRFGESLRVYDIADDYTSPIDLTVRNPRERRELERLEALEQEMMRETDVVLAVSEALAEKKRTQCGGVHVVPNGCEFERFSADTGPEPSDLQDLPRPRLVFAGAIWPRVDLEALGRLADDYADGSVVLLGPLLPGLDASRLLSRRNVHWLGPKPHHELPRYLRHVDVGLLPYKPTELTRCSSPLKLWEYLAAGCGVASVPIPQVLELAGDDVDVAPAADLTSAVRAALARDSLAARRARQRLAGRHDWTARAAQVEAILAEALGRRRPLDGKADDTDQRCA